MIKKEIQIFLNALAFYTRIPCYKWCNYSVEYTDKSTKYLPLIGWIVGGFGGIVFIISSCLFPHSIAILLSMISTILITGAFHEDGFADFCDGFGGGINKEQILRIMKDSSIGTYALIGIISLLTLKYLTLSNINFHVLPFMLIAGNGISRFVLATLIFTEEYVRKNDDNAKALKISEKAPLSVVITAAILAFIPLFLLGIKYLLVLIPLFIIRQIYIAYLRKKIGGYTGDCLGSIQQISEVVFYISAYLIARFVF